MRHPTTKRRTVAALATGVALATALSGCAGSARTPGDAAENSGTITLGMISPLSGPLAQTTTDSQRGAQVAIDQINAAGGVRDGQQLALEVVNEPTDPAGSVTAMRNFDAEGVPIVFGNAVTPGCLAAAPVAESLGILDISHGCAGSTLTGPNREVDSFFSAAGSDAMQAYALGEVLPERFPGVQNLYQVGYDYLPGIETWDYIKRTWMEKAPVQVRQEFAVPTSQLDFRSIVSTLGAAATAPPETQGLVLTTYGAGTLALLQQMQQAGLLDRFAFISNTFMYYQPAVEFGGNAPAVVDSYSYVYWDAHDNPVNERFVEEYRRIADGGYPSDWSFHGYVAVLAAAKALDQVETVDLPSLVAALEGMTIDGPTGTFTISADSHQFNFPVVVGELVGDPSRPDGVGLNWIMTIPGEAASQVRFE